MFKKIKIKLTPTSKEEKEIYFDPEVFSLIDQQTNNIQECLQKKIAIALIPHHYKDFPYYVSRLMRQKNGYYKVLILDASHRIEAIIINLSTCKEIREESKEKEIHTDLINIDKLDFIFGENSFVPDFFDLRLEKNQPILAILNKYIAQLKKEKQIENFSSGKIFMPYGIELQPAPPQIITIEDYTFHKALEVFEPLTQLASLIEEAKEIEVTYTSYLKKLNETFIATEKIDDKLLDYAIMISQDLDLTELASIISSKQSKISAMLESANADFAIPYINYINLQKKLNFIKNSLAWSLHYAAGKYFNLLQEKTENDGAARMGSIESFNKHFKNLLQIENERVSDITLVYEHFSIKSLNEIAATLNELLSECNTTTGWPSNKQKELVHGINTGASIIKDASIKSPPFKAWDKYVLGFGKAGFQWEKNVIEDEAAAEKQAAFVQQTLETGGNYQALKVINFTVEKKRLQILDEKFTEFETKINNHKTLLHFKSHANTIKERVKDLFINNSVDSLEIIQHNMIHDFDTIEACSQQTHRFIIDNKRVKTTEFNVRHYIQQQVQQAKLCFDKICSLEIYLDQMIQLDPLCSTAQINRLEQIISCLKLHFEKIQNTKKTLENLSNQIKTIHHDVVDKPSIKKLDQIQTTQVQNESIPPSALRGRRNAVIDIPLFNHEESNVQHASKSAPIQKKFFRRHWGKILASMCAFSSLAIAGIFTGGAIPFIAALFGGGTSAAAGAISATAISGGLLGGAIGAGISTLNGPSREDNIKGFFKRNWKKILLGCGIGLLAVGIAAAGVLTFGASFAALGAISAATAASAGTFGISMSSTLAGIAGCTMIATSSIIVGATIGGCTASIIENRHFQAGNSSTKISPKPVPHDSLLASKSPTFNHADIHQALSKHQHGNESINASQINPILETVNSTKKQLPDSEKIRSNETISGQISPVPEKRKPLFFHALFRVFQGPYPWQNAQVLTQQMKKPM